MFQSKSPKDDPRGHPRFIGFQMLLISPSFTLFRLFSKNNRIKSSDPLPKPYVSNFFVVREWLNEQSKA